MPDVLIGKPLTEEIMPSDPEEREKLGKVYFGEGGPGYFPAVLERIKSVTEAIRSTWPSVEKIGAFGLCFGGKVRVTSSVWS